MTHFFDAETSNSVFLNVSTLRNSNSISCSFLYKQSLYCVVCCCTDPIVPPDSSVYNISTTRGTEVSVSIEGLSSGQMYYCKAAGSNTNSTHCAGPVVEDVKIYFSFVTSLPSTTHLSTCRGMYMYMMHFHNTYIVLEWYKQEAFYLVRHYPFVTKFRIEFCRIYHQKK